MSEALHEPEGGEPPLIPDPDPERAAEELTDPTRPFDPEVPDEEPEEPADDEGG